MYYIGHYNITSSIYTLHKTFTRLHYLILSIIKLYSLFQKAGNRLTNLIIVWCFTEWSATYTTWVVICNHNNGWYKYTIRSWYKIKQVSCFLQLLRFPQRQKGVDNSDFFLSSFHVLYPMFHVSLDCTLLEAPSVF
jgi:hypothetical protein